MARRSAADKEKTHQQIVSHASREFRSRGSSVGIADLMNELGLTQGGFYRHFASKDDMFIEAVALSFAELGDRLQGVADAAQSGARVGAIISAYLSEDHLTHPETWCSLASLAPEIGRMPIAVRKRIDAATHTYMERMSLYMPGSSSQEKSRNFILLFSAMAGAIALCRSLGDPHMQKAALTMAREHQLTIFASQETVEQVK